MRSITANMISPAEAAGELGVTRRTLDRWHQRRIGPPRIQVQNKVWYRREAVLQWLIGHEVTAPGAETTNHK